MSKSTEACTTLKSKELADREGWVNNAGTAWSELQSFKLSRGTREGLSYSGSVGVSHLQLLSPTLDAGMGAGYAIIMSLVWNERNSSANESFLPTFVLFRSRDKLHGDMDTWCCTCACSMLLLDFWVFDAAHPILTFRAQNHL